MKFLIYMLYFLPSVCLSAYDVSWAFSVTDFTRATSLSCSVSGPELMSGYTAEGLVFVGCSSDPIQEGTQIFWSKGGVIGYWTVAAINEVEVPETFVCIPAFRTISPCPSGYAPNNMLSLDSSDVNPYLSEFDSMPVQDILYSIGMCLFGLLGLGVGVKLI